MHIRCDVRKGVRTFCYVLSASAMLVAAVGGQDTPVPQRQIKAEIKAVVRISKKLIDEVIARREVTGRIPVNACIMHFHSQGVLDGRGKLQADLKTEKGDGMFVMNGQGTYQAWARNVRGPLVAVTPASGPFTTRTLVRFDGRKFSRNETTVWSQVHLQLDHIEGRRGAFLGRAVGRVMQPVGQWMVPRAAREAAPVGNQYLKTFVNEFADQIINTLNRTTPVEVSLNRLFPETTDWEFSLSTEPGFIQAAYGPPNSEVPILPENPGRLEDVRLELWVRSTTQGAETLDTLSKQPLARQLIQRYLEATLPELAALTEERSVTAVGSWVVICIGTPKSSK